MMEKINGEMTQKEFDAVINEIMRLTGEHDFKGIDNSEKINELKAYISSRLNPTGEGSLDLETIFLISDLAEQDLRDGETITAFYKRIERQYDEKYLQEFGRPRPKDEPMDNTFLIIGVPSPALGMKVAQGKSDEIGKKKKGNK